MTKLKKNKDKDKGKKAAKGKSVKAKTKGKAEGKSVKAKGKGKVEGKTKKSVKRAGASAGPNATLAFNISGCSPKLVKALDKAAVVKASKDGHRVSRSRLINSVLEAKFL